MIVHERESRYFDAGQIIKKLSQLELQIQVWKYVIFLIASSILCLVKMEYFFTCQFLIFCIWFFNGIHQLNFCGCIWRDCHESCCFQCTLCICTLRIYAVIFFKYFQGLSDIFHFEIFNFARQISSTISTAAANAATAMVFCSHTFVAATFFNTYKKTCNSVSWCQCSGIIATVSLWPSHHDCYSKIMIGKHN